MRMTEKVHEKGEPLTSKKKGVLEADSKKNKKKPLGKKKREALNG